MSAEVVDPDDTDGPIHVLPETWDDEKMHALSGDWQEPPCWCEPHIDGKYVHHRSVFDTVNYSHAKGADEHRQQVR